MSATGTPDGRPPRRRKQGSMLVTAAAAGLIIAVVVVVLLIELASSGSVKNQLGSKTYLAGRATEFAPSIAQQGPLLLGDLAGGTRPVFLQHLGPDPKLGWVAIQAIAPNGSTKCVIQWHQPDHDFTDPCTGVAYPPDGAGLIRYSAVVLPSGRVNVDLRAALPADTTITTGTVPPHPTP